MKIFFFILFSIPFFAHAQYQNIQIQSRVLKCSAKDKGTVVLYVNGQENRANDVDAVVDKVKELMKLQNLGLEKKMDSRGLVAVDFVFNPTLGNIGGSAISDFIESAALLLQNRGVSQKTAWINVYGGYILGLAYKRIASIFNGTELVIDPESQKALDKGYKYLLVSETEVSDDLKNKIFSYLLIAQKKVIIVSHSQGNLFTNKFYQDAVGESITHPVSGKNLFFNDFEKYLANAQIATPAEFIAIPNGNYITNQLDSINDVDWAGPIRPLPANFVLVPPPLQDTFERYDRKNNHRFLDVYLYGEASEFDTVKYLTQQTIQNWVDVAATLESNCGTKPVIKSITADAADPLNPLMFRFSADITDPEGGPFIYDWHFGDTYGSTSNAPNPVFSYNQNGSYTVSLVVTDPTDLSSEVFTKTISTEMAQGCNGAEGYYLNTGMTGSKVFVANTAVVPQMIMAMGDVEFCDHVQVQNGASFMTSNAKIIFRDNAIVSGVYMINNVSKPIEFTGETVISQGASINLSGSNLEFTTNNAQFTGLINIRSQGAGATQIHIQDSSVKGMNITNSGPGIMNVSIDTSQLNSDFNFTSNSSQTVSASFVGSTLVEGGSGIMLHATSPSPVIQLTLVHTRVNGGINLNSSLAGTAGVTLLNSEINGVSSRATASGSATLNCESCVLSIGIASTSNGAGNSTVNVKNSTISELDSKTSGSGNATATITNTQSIGSPIVNASSSGNATLEINNAQINESTASIVSSSIGASSAYLTLSGAMDGRLISEAATVDTYLTVGDGVYVCKVGYIMNRNGEVSSSVDFACKL